LRVAIGGDAMDGIVAWCVHVCVGFFVCSET